MVPVGLSLFHPAQRGTCEEHLVFREPSYSALQWYHDGASVPSTEGSGIDSGLLGTILHSVRTGSGVHPATQSATFRRCCPRDLKRLNHESVFQLPQMLRFGVCGGRLHLHPYTVLAWRCMKRKRNVSYAYYVCPAKLKVLPYCTEPFTAQWSQYIPQNGHYT